MPAVMGMMTMVTTRLFDRATTMRIVGVRMIVMVVKVATMMR